MRTREEIRFGLAAGARRRGKPPSYVAAPQECAQPHRYSSLNPCHHGAAPQPQTWLSISPGRRRRPAPARPWPPLAPGAGREPPAGRGAQPALCRPAIQRPSRGQRAAVYGGQQTGGRRLRRPRLPAQSPGGCCSVAHARARPIRQPAMPRACAAAAAACGRPCRSAPAGRRRHPQLLLLLPAACVGGSHADPEADGPRGQQHPGGKRGPGAPHCSAAGAAWLCLPPPPPSCAQ